MFMDAVIEHLEANGVGTFGVDIFGSTYPSTAPNQCVVVKDGGGPPPSKYIPTQVRVIQFVSRAPDYPDAAAKANQMFELFHGKVSGGNWDSLHNYLLGTTPAIRQYVQSSEALQVPSDIGPDEKGRAEVSFNIAFKIRLRS